MNADEEVKGTLTDSPATIEQICGCGATFKVTMPSIFIDTLTKQANTWSRFHVCSIRPDVQPQAGAKQTWLKAGIGEPCIVCDKEIEAGGSDWWRIAGKWVHVDCVTCADCGMPARGNGTMVFTIGKEFVHVKCPKEGK